MKIDLFLALVSLAYVAEKNGAVNGNQKRVGYRCVDRSIYSGDGARRVSHH